MFTSACEYLLEIIISQSKIKPALSLPIKPPSISFLLSKANPEVFLEYEQFQSEISS